MITVLGTKNNRSRTTRRTFTVLAAAAVAAAVLTPLTASGAPQPAPKAVAAQAAAPAAAPAADAFPAPVSGSPLSAFTRISDFYGAYMDAVSTENSGNLSDQLRSFYLTPQLNKTLVAWEAKNHADGVLRAQDVPQSWTVTYDGSGTGHTWAIVTLTWGGGETTRLHVQADLATRLISDIKPL